MISTENLELKQEIKPNKFMGILNAFRIIMASVTLMVIIILFLELSVIYIILAGLLSFIPILAFYFKYGDAYRIKIYDKGVKFRSHFLPEKFEEQFVRFKDINRIYKEKSKRYGKMLVVGDIQGNRYEVRGMNYVNKILPYLHKNLGDRWEDVYIKRGELR